MRTYIRLLAPISILATALYLAFISMNHAESKSFPITTVDNQASNIVIPINPTAGHLAIDKVRNPNSKDVSGTSNQNHS